MSAHIVVVEDEASIAEVLQYNLERAGYEVATEVRGERALERIRAVPPDLLLLDLMLPGLDGLDVLKALRRDPRTSRLLLSRRRTGIDRPSHGRHGRVARPSQPLPMLVALGSRRQARGGPRGTDRKSSISIEP